MTQDGAALPSHVVSVRLVFGAFQGSVVFILAVVIWVLMYTAGIAAVDATVAQLRGETVSSVAASFQHLMEVGSECSTVVERLVSPQQLIAKDVTAYLYQLRFYRSMLQTYDLYSLGYSMFNSSMSATNTDFFVRDEETTNFSMWRFYDLPEEGGTLMPHTTLPSMQHFLQAHSYWEVFLLEEDDLIFSDYYWLPSMGEYAQSIFKRIRVDGTLYGVAYSMRRVQDIARVFEKIPLDPGDAFVCNTKGELVASTIPGLASEFSSPSSRKSVFDQAVREAYPIVGEAIDTITRHEPLDEVATSQFSTTLNGSSVLIDVQAMSFVDGGWILVLLTPADAFYKPVEKFSTVALGVSVALVVFAVLMSILGVWTVTRPIAELATAMGSVSSSLDTPRFQPRSRVEYKEILAIKNAMDRMVFDVLTTKEGLEKTISDRTKDLEAETEKATLASEAKGKFLVMMSHEIRTPLNGICGMGRLLKETVLTPEQEEYVSIMGLSAEVLYSVLNNVLDYSKLTTGKIEIEKRPVNLLNIVQGVCSLYETSHVDSAVKVYLRFPVEFMNASFLLDELRLKQILCNLMSNARKFTETGFVLLFVDLDDNGEEYMVSVDVIDTGIGIEKAKLDTIFQAFSQADASVARSYGGTGLGVTIASLLVRVLGGTLLAGTKEFARECWRMSNGTTIPFKNDRPPHKYAVIAQSERETLTGARFCFRFPAELVDKGCGRSSTLQLDNVAVLEYNLLPQTHCILSEAFHHWNVAYKEAENLAALHDMIRVRQNPASKRRERILIVTQDVSDREALVGLQGGQQEVVVVTILKHGQKLDPELIHQNLCSIYLPIKQQALLQVLTARVEEKRTAHVARPAVFEYLAGMEVLVVEDNKVNLKVMTRLLEKRNFIVRSAFNGLEACEFMQKKNNIGLIFMDVQMPVMDGYAATRRLREEGVSVPIIAMTAGVSELDRSTCFECGMDSFLPKPFTIGQLNDVLESVFQQGPECKEEGESSIVETYTDSEYDTSSACSTFAVSV